VPEVRDSVRYSRPTSSRNFSRSLISLRMRWAISRSFALSLAGRPENQFETHFGRLLEVYTRVQTPDGQPLLFEAYFSYEDVSRRSAEVLRSFRPITAR